MSRHAHRQAARDQRVCAVTGRRGGFHAHHAIREEDVSRQDPHDPRNALRVLPTVHWDHHWGMIRIELRALTDENIEFAIAEFGEERAADYLHQRYAGDDPRLDFVLSDEALNA